MPFDESIDFVLCGWPRCPFQAVPILGGRVPERHVRHDWGANCNFALKKMSTRRDLSYGLPLPVSGVGGSGGGVFGPDEAGGVTAAGWPGSGGSAGRAGSAE